MEETWIEEDKYVVFNYLNKERERETFVILEVYKETPNTIKVVEYPLTENPKPFLLGINRAREKESWLLFEKAGDWSYFQKLTRSEIEKAKETLGRPKTKRTLDDIL